MSQVCFESMRVADGKVFNLEYHQRRVDKSSDIKLHDVVKSLSLPNEGVYKLRISYTPDQVLRTDIDKYLPKKIETLKAVSDESIDYSLKREDRSALNRLHGLKGNCDDVLIIKHGMVTDTSFCNILFYDGSKWVTPSTPLLEGTCRARLISEGKILVEDVSVTDIQKYKCYMLVNAMLDFDLRRTKMTSTICVDV